MNENDEDMISDTFEDFKLKKPYQALTNLLQEIDTQNIDLDINQSKFEELKKIMNDIHESANNRGQYGNRDFYNFISIIFRAERIIQNQNDKIISKLTKNSKLNGKNDFQLDGYNAQIGTNQNKSASESEVIQSIANHFNISATSHDLPSLINSLDKVVSDQSNNVVLKVSQAFNLPLSTNSSNLITNLKTKINETYRTGGVNQSQKEDLYLDSDSSSTAPPLGPSDDPSDPQVGKSQLVSTVNFLRNQIVILKESIVTQEAILKEFEGIPIKTDEIDNILISDAPILTKIKNIINVLSLSLFASEDTSASNEKLLSCVSGLFRFITSLGQSKNSYTSLYSETPFEEMRSILLLQSERVSIFLNDHGMGLTHDNSLFESLLHQTGSLSMLDSVNKYLRTYTGKPKSAEGQQLYVLLMEAVTACDILRKFATEASKTCKQQINDVRQLKDYSKNLEKSIETQQIETITHIKESNDKVDETVSTVRTILRNAVLNENLTDIRPVIQALDSIAPKNDRRHGRRGQGRGSLSYNDGVDEEEEDNEYTSDGRRNDDETENSKSGYDYKRDINDAEYINSLQNQIYQARDKILELQKSRENLIKQTQSDLLKVREQVNKKLEETKQKFKEKKTENRKLFLALKDTSEKLEELKADYEELRKSKGINVDSENENRSTKSNRSNRSSKSNKSNKSGGENNNNNNNQENRNVNTNENSDNEAAGFDDDQLRIIKEIQEQFIGAKEDYEKVLKSMRREIQDYQETKQREFDSAKESFEGILAKKQAQIEEEKQKNKLLKKKNDKLKEDYDKLNNELIRSKQCEKDAIDNAAKISENYQEIHDDYVALEMTKNQLQEDADKRAHSMKDLLEERRQLNDSYSQLSKELDETRSNSTKVLQDTCSSIARLFPSYYDFSMKLEPDSIIQMLEKVKEREQSSNAIEKKLEKRNNYLNQLNELLNVEKSSQLFEEVDKLKRKATQASEEVIEKAKENKALNDSRMNFLQIQDWLIRMYVLCSGGVCQDVTTTEMENAVEEVLLSSFGNMLQSRKMGILKAEKKLLSKPELREVLKKSDTESSNQKDSKKGKKEKKASFRHLLIMMMLLIKTKKLAGNMEQNTYENETYMNQNSNMNLTEEHTEDDIFPNSPTNQPLSPIMNYGSAF